MIRKFIRGRQVPEPGPALPPGDPASLQEHIRVVQEMRGAAAPPRRGPAGKLLLGGTVLAAIVALWQFGPRFGWGPGGRGAGNGAGNGASVDGQSRTPATGGGGGDDAARLSAAQQPPARTPQRPLRVTIDGERYVLDGKDVDLATITSLAATVPPGDGPAVEVKRAGSSRVKAEQDLKAALDERHLPATWTPPLE